MGGSASFLGARLVGLASLRHDAVRRLWGTVGVPGETAIWEGVGSRLAGLQALRAFAAYLVVIDHALLALVAGSVLPDHVKAVAYRLGDAGVFIFFVISGFIIARSGQQDRDIDGAVRFFMRRLRRIVPLYWLATFVYVARLWLDGNMPSVADLTRSLLFLPYFNDAQMLRPVLAQGWTLNFEMYFYLLFAACLVLGRRSGMVVLGAMLIVPVLYGALAGWQEPGGDAAQLFLSSPVVVFFLLGIAVQSFERRLRPVSSAWMFTGTVVIIGLAAYLIWGSAADDVFFCAMMVLAPLAVVLVITAKPQPQGGLWSALVKAGDASYATYLTHGFVVGPLAALFVTFGLDGAWVAIFLVVCVVAASRFGWLSYRFVERPLSELLRPSRERLAAERAN